MQKTNEQIKADLLAHIRINKGFLLWMAVLVILLAVCLGAYVVQLQKGLGVTGLRDYITWGMYISNFVFFVACSLVGMLISSVLGMLNQKWAAPLTRIAEIIAFAFAAVAGLVIISDMGRPDRFLNVFLHARIQSPIFWDVTVVSTYVVISMLLYILPMLPDLKIMHESRKDLPLIQQNIYKLLSMGWADKPEQYEIVRKSTRTLLILIIPVAFAIHTVTSWLMAVTPRAGWNSTIFGPYFISGAFVAGCAAVIIAMYFFRKKYRLQDYITEKHFDKMGKLLMLVSLVYLYFNINELIVPGYKLEKAEAVHLHSLFAGRYAMMFWTVQLAGLVIPIILLLFKKIRNPLPMLIIGITVLAAAWFKRYLIVVPVQEHPFLPIQNVPGNFIFYTPTLIETAVTGASIILVLIIVTVLSKFFPVIPVRETMAEINEQKD